MNIVARVKEILLTPTTTWPVIETEATSLVALYTQYIMILAAIQAVAGFIGMSLFGISAMGVSIRVPFMTGLIQMVLGYGLALVMVYVMSLIADFLAPSFGGQKNAMSALKLVAYSGTAAMVGGIFAAVPALGILTLIAGLYSLYLLYLGVPVLMKVPKEKALPYTAVLVVCAIVVGVIAGAILGAIRGPSIDMSALPSGHAANESPQMAKNAPAIKMTIETPKDGISVDVAKVQDWSKQMEEVSKKLEKAQQSGDKVAMEQVVNEMAALQQSMPMSAPKK